MERIPKQVVDDILRLNNYIKSANELALQDMIRHDRNQDGSKGKTAFQMLKEDFHAIIIRVVEEKYIDLNFRSIAATIEYMGDYAGCRLCTGSIEWYPEEM